MTEGGYKRYLLVVLLVILVFSSVDGLALGLVLQEIKRDLRLSDTQLGLLSGIAFSLFYAVMGIPLARWADRGNRVTLIAVTAMAWSVLVASCGLVASFIQLLLVRVGVAVGEAGCVPPAHSLIADYFTRAQRPRAVAIYMLGGPLSMVVGYFAAGWLNEFYGWRATFVLLGLPGLIPAALARLTLREPRLAPTQKRETRESVPALGEVLITLRRSATFVHLLMSFSVVCFFGYGILQWQPAFFIRSYGVDTGELGTWLAVIYGVGGILGTYLGGELASRYASNREGLQLRAMAVAACVFGVFSALIYLSQSRYLAFASMAVAVVGGATTSGPLFAIIQTLVPQRMRAMSIAIIYLFANLVGTGLGPLVVGALSDVLRPVLGEQSLRYALLMLCPGYLWSAWHLWQASRSVARDLNHTVALT